MKEKTFEELIKDRIDNFTPSEMVKLLQQVREATVNEIADLVEENGDKILAGLVRLMPTDSINIK